MKKTNPFLIATNPYRDNPFHVLELPANINQGTLNTHTRFWAPIPGTQHEVDGHTAGEYLRNNLLRLAFTVMINSAATREEGQR